MAHDVSNSPTKLTSPERWAGTRWGRLTSLVALVVALALVRLLWGLEADRRLGRQLSEISSRNLPVSADDLRAAVPVVTDGANAAEYWSAAERALDTKVESPSQSVYEFRPYPPFPAKWHEMIDGAVAKNRTAMTLARQARQYDLANWKFPLTSPLFRSFPRYTNKRDLANLLADAALREHLRGNDREAIELVNDLLHQAAAIDQQPFMVSHLVAIGIEALAVNRIAVIAPRLTIAKPDNPANSRDAAAGSAVTADDVRQLIKQLLDPALDERTARAFIHERVFQIDSTDLLTSNIWLMRPMLKLDLARVLDRHESLIQASRLDTWPQARAVLETLPSLPENQALKQRLMPMFGSPDANAAPPRYSRMLSSLYSPAAMDRFVLTGFRSQVQRHMVAASLAIQLYRADHGGRWPDSIHVLVPRYLPSVPRDPFALDAPLGFALITGGLPDGSPRPLIYSVGEDGNDDMSAGVPPPSVPCFDWRHVRSSDRTDQFLDVSRWSPADEPDANANEHDDRESASASTMPADASSETVDDDP